LTSELFAVALRLKTEITGFDAMTRGGFMKGDTVMPP